MLAMRSLVPASRRSLGTCVRPLLARLRPLMQSIIDEIIDAHLPDVFKPSVRTATNTNDYAMVWSGWFFLFLILMKQR